MVINEINIMATYKRFEDLDIWQRSRELSKIRNQRHQYKASEPESEYKPGNFDLNL